MVDIDDKHGKRDKQVQRGVTLLVAVVFAIIVALAIWQHSQESRHLRSSKKHYPGERVKLGHKKNTKSAFLEKPGFGKIFSHGHHDRPAAGNIPPHHHHATPGETASLARKLNRHDIIVNAEERFKAEHLERHKHAYADGKLDFDKEGLQQRLKENLQRQKDAEEGQ